MSQSVTLTNDECHTRINDLADILDAIKRFKAKQMKSVAQ